MADENTVNEEKESNLRLRHSLKESEKSCDDDSQSLQSDLRSRRSFSREKSCSSRDSRNEFEEGQSTSSYTSVDSGLSSESSRRSKRKEKLKRRKQACCSCLFLVVKLLILIPLLILAVLLLIGYSMSEHKMKCYVETLSSSLYSNIYGQETAVKTILETVQHFCDGPTLSDPLVLLFWGPTGVGKTLMVTLLAQHFKLNHVVVPSQLFKKEQYHDWIASNNIPHFTADIEPYIYVIDDVMSVIEMKNIAGSMRSVGHHVPLIVILSTSLESNLLNDSFIEHGLKATADDRFEYNGVLPSIVTELSEFNSVLVPFLPLSKTHVKLCIEKSLLRSKIKHNDMHVEKIAAEFEYFNDGKRLYSHVGCKTLNDKIFRILAP